MTRIIPTEKVIELLTMNCNIKGFVGADDWEHARPVTIQTFLKDIFDHCGGVIWMADIPECDIYITKNIFAPGKEDHEEGEKEDESTEPRDVQECGTAPEDDKDILQEAADPDEDAVEKVAVQVPDDIIEDAAPKVEKRTKDFHPFGKWEEYKGKALSNLESQKIAEEMTKEGYSAAKISMVIRKSAQTVINWRNKFGWDKPEGDQ